MGQTLSVAAGPRRPLGNPDVKPFLAPVALPLMGLCFSLRAAGGCCQHPALFVCPWWGVLLWLVLLGSQGCMSGSGSCWSPAELRAPAQPEALHPPRGQMLFFSRSDPPLSLHRAWAGGDVVHGTVQPYPSLGFSPKSRVGIALKEVQEPFAVPKAPGLQPVPCQPAGTGLSPGHWGSSVASLAVPPTSATLHGSRCSMTCGMDPLLPNLMCGPRLGTSLPPKTRCCVAPGYITPRIGPSRAELRCPGASRSLQPPLPLTALTQQRANTDPGRAVKRVGTLCFTLTANLLLRVSVPERVEKNPFATLLQPPSWQPRAAWKSKINWQQSSHNTNRLIHLIFLIKCGNTVMTTGLSQ